MMRLAGLSVAFRAKPVVRKEATLSINHAGLDALLHRLID
jgi:phosphoserine phosphatase